MSATRQLFLKHLAPTSPSPMGLEIVQGRGIYLKSAGGKRYMDLISGISVSNLGHHHPVVHKAILKQLKRFTHLMVYGELVQAPQVKFATALANVLPSALQSVYFVNSGSEAIEGALKLAKRATGRHEIISCENAYHGSSHGALSIMGSEYFKSAFRPLLPGVRHIRFNHWEDLEKITCRTACVVMETVQGEAGALPPLPGYLKAVKERCAFTGTLLILDEIQAGFGRTGSLFGFEQEEVVPDVLVLAKGFGGGMPLGAFIASPELMQTLSVSPVLGHITTFGGHPVSCAAGAATLDVLQAEQLPEKAKEHEAWIRSTLNHPLLQDISGRGLLLALHFTDTETNFAVIREALHRGLLTDWFLFNDKALRLAPPLIITPTQLKKACDVLMKAMDAVYARRGVLQTPV